MSQVKNISGLVGGDQILADMAGVHVSNVSRWKRRRGGVIPAWHQQKIMEQARQRGVRLNPSDFFPAAPKQPSKKR